jgi:hypothetical protein
MLKLTEDGSIEDSSGKILFFSTDRFVKDICEGDCCFVCGISPERAEFNNEHVLPEWILRKYGLFSRSLELPNGTTIRYDQYMVPCCCECNTFMGKTFEEPLSALLTQGHQAVSECLKTNPAGSWLIFVWLALIYLKTHLKDRTLRFHRDLRLPDGNIGDVYEWTQLHHIHCIARSFYTQCALDAKVGGSLLVLPAKLENQVESFDYGDMYMARTILLRIEDVAFLAVLNDSGAARTLCQSIEKGISGNELSSLQLRELMAHFAFINLNLKDRPRYHSESSPDGTLTITAELPEMVGLLDSRQVEYGTVLYECCKEILQNLRNSDKESIIDHAKRGTISFLTDKDNRFIPNSVEFIASSSPL